MLRNYIKKLFQKNASPYKNVGKVFVVVLMIILASTNISHAAGWFEIPLWDWFTQLAAYTVNLFLSIASWFVALTGMLLNVSITLTLHIKDFLESTPAIYTVWKAIRDITGLFIIFALLYAAIRMILGQDAKLGSLISNIVIAGVLINFSFFVTALLIDVSNVVSLQLYKAITPGQPSISQVINDPKRAPGSELSTLVNGLMNDGGLSAVFMQSLQIQSAFHPNSFDLSGKRGEVNMAPFRIVFIGITGIVIMLTAGLSFLFAALAFIVRLIILLFLLAFSPIWCAAFVVPQLKDYSKKWLETLIGQLIFMPAYLLLMYVALKILTGSSLFNSGAYGGLWKGMDAGALVPTEFITFAINAVFIIFMLNVPLVVALKLGASTGGLLDGNKMGADMLWKKVGGYAGSKYIGGAAARLDASIDKSRFGISRLGNTLLGKDIRNATLGAAAKSKFGGSRSYEETKKAEKETAKGGVAIERRHQFNRAISDPTIKDPSDNTKLLIDTTMSRMTEKERLALGTETLKDPNVVKRLKKSDFEAISKSDDFDTKDKKEIEDARKTALIESAKGGDADTVKFMLGNMSDDDKRSMSKTREEALGEAVKVSPTTGSKTVENIVNSMTGKELMNMPDVTKPEVIRYIKNSQLKEMADESIDDTKKKVIGNAIAFWDTGFTPYSGGKTHKALSFMNEARNHHWWN